jgi:hypothetical protein
MHNPHESPPLTRETILNALSILDEKLREEGVIGEICLYGGTAMVLAFNARLSTKDVDAVFEPPEVFRRRAREIAEELNLGSDWLNDGVKGYVSGAPEYTGDGLPQMSNLRMIRPTAEYLLAMKCMAARFPSYTTQGDRDDIAFLLNRLGLKDAEAVYKLVEKFYPPERILPKTHFLIRELLESQRSGTEAPGTFTHIDPQP